MKAAVQALYQRADHGATLKDMMDGICDMLKAHEADIRDVTYSYRLCATDTGYVKAFSLVNGRYVEKSEMDEADTIVSGRESDLLAVLQRKLSPMSAILRGKITVRGSKAALIRFTEFL